MVFLWEFAAVWYILYLQNGNHGNPSISDSQKFQQLSDPSGPPVAKAEHSNNKFALWVRHQEQPTLDIRANKPCRREKSVQDLPWPSWHSWRFFYHKHHSTLWEMELPSVSHSSGSEFLHFFCGSEGCWAISMNMFNSGLPLSQRSRAEQKVRKHHELTAEEGISLIPSVYPDSSPGGKGLE